MNTMTDALTIVRELTSRWPNGRLTDEHLDDLVPRLQPYDHADIVDALEGHKSRSKWPPEWSELLLILQAAARARRPAMYGTTGEAPFPVILAERLNLPPVQAVLVYWRQCWTRFMSVAAERQAGPGALADSWERMAAERARVVQGAASNLAVAGCDPEWARTAAELVTALPVDFYRLLDRIKAEGAPRPKCLPPTPRQLQPIYGLSFRAPPAMEDADEKPRQVKALAIADAAGHFGPHADQPTTQVVEVVNTPQTSTLGRWMWVAADVDPTTPVGTLVGAPSLTTATVTSH